MPGFLAPLAMSLLPSVLGKVFNFKTWTMDQILFTQFHSKTDSHKGFLKGFLT